MLRDKLKRILKIEKALVENPAELLADIAFRFYKKFIFKDGVERREKITVVIATTVMMIVLGLIVAGLAFIVLGCIRAENSIFEICKCCLK